MVKFAKIFTLKKHLLLAILFVTIIGTFVCVGQSKKPIVVEYSDFNDVDEDLVPGAFLLSGSVRLTHDGAVITCNKAYFFKKENYLKAFGNVQIVQGDTLFLNSDYAEYNGTIKQAFATGNPILRSPDMSLTTDTINFNRNSQEAYYRSTGVIINKENTLRSKSGRYYANQKKFKFLTAVTVTNPKYVIKSNHLDYYNNSGHSYLFGPSTITGKDNFIYTENGFYNSKKNIGHFLRKSYIRYKDRVITGDSLYYDRNIEFASATNNVVITDSINKGLVKGHYAEMYKKKDSMFMTKHAVAMNLVDKDTLYIHGKRLVVTGKPENRIIRAFNNARFYKIDLSGKCDSIHSSTKTALTQLIKNPVLWNGENQMTGDIIYLIGDKKTEKLDSLKVINNAFIISKDTLGKGYNQTKGLNLYGKFKDNKLSEVDIVKNTEVIYYAYDKLDFIGIEKKISSKINMIMENNKVSILTSYKNVESQTYPEKDFPENVRKLRGFIWRGDEMIKTKDDIFPPEETALHEKILAATRKSKLKPAVQMKIRKETKDYDKKTKSKGKTT